MPIYAVQFAVTAEPITFPQIHAESQEQAIQQAHDWAPHILEQGGHAVSLGELLEAIEVGPETGIGGDGALFSSAPVGD